MNDVECYALAHALAAHLPKTVPWLAPELVAILRRPDVQVRILAAASTVDVMRVNAALACTAAEAVAAADKIKRTGHPGPAACEVCGASEGHNIGYPCGG